MVEDAWAKVPLTMMPTVVVGAMAVVMPDGNSHVLGLLAPPPQAPPEPATTPVPLICRHWVEPLPRLETVRLLVEAVLAKRLVIVVEEPPKRACPETEKMVVVEFVKTAVEAVVAPMVIPLIVPPVRVALGERSVVMEVEAPPRTARPDTERMDVEELLVMIKSCGKV